MFGAGVIGFEVERELDGRAEGHEMFEVVAVHGDFLDIFDIWLWQQITILAWNNWC